MKKEINVKNMDFKILNEIIHKSILEGKKRFYLKNVIGQRYIGAGLPHGVEIEIFGVPGQDLGVFNGGCKITVYGNSQDGVGNTMNDGFIVVYGNVGDIPGHMIRNGKIYIRGSAGYRAGIMMKEYGNKRPVIIVGETIGDYVGEYMAGGTIIVLGYSLKSRVSPVTRYVGSGIFGGRIYIRGRLTKDQLGKGANAVKVSPDKMNEIMPYLKEYSDIFELSMDKILNEDFWLVEKTKNRPFKNLYVSSNKIGGEYLPVHIDSKAPCSNACPIGIPNPVIIRMINNGEIDDAYKLIDDYTPFRHTGCGYLCPGFCMKECTRNDYDGAFKINEIAKRYHPLGKAKKVNESNDIKISIIGAGPAGLSASWHLARKGFLVDVYEKEDVLGGKIYFNIPENKVPWSVFESEIERIKSLGINFYTGIKVDKALFKKIRNEYNATIIAVGALQPRKINFKGEEFSVSSIDFLRNLRIGGYKDDILNKEIVVLGGGNVAVDVVEECMRYGAKKITVVDIKKPSAFLADVERLVNMGVDFLYPLSISEYDGLYVSFKEGKTLRADLLIKAIGENVNFDFLEDEVYIDAENLSTNLKDVFVIGDCLKPGFIADAIAMGKKVSDLLYERYTGNSSEKEEGYVVDKSRINLVYFERRDVLSIEEEMCFSCGNCVQCDICVENCPRNAIKRIDKNFEIDYEICAGCGVCASLCPRGAIVLIPRSKLIEEERAERATITPQVNFINNKVGEYS